jgi:hypothetical protein
MAAFGTRNLVRFAQWRGRRSAERDLKAEARARPGASPVFRGFIQINLIKSR